MKRLALLLALISPSAFAVYDFQKVINGTSGVDFDTRCFPAQQILDFPSLANLNAGDSYPAEHWRFYAIAGDKSVTASRVCGNVAPTWSIDEAGALETPETDTLTTTDLNDPTWSIANMVAGSGKSFNIVVDNSVGSAATISRPWTVTASGTSDEIIDQHARSFFVSTSGSPTADGKSCSTPLRSLSDIPSKATQTGDDIWLKSGDSWTGEYVLSGPGGVDANNLGNIGTYRCDAAGTAFVVKPTNQVASSTGSLLTYAYPRAILSGSYHNSCRGSSKQAANNADSAAGPKCAYNTAHPPASWGSSSVPADANTALLTINGGKFWSIHDLDFRDTAGIHLNFKLTCAGGQTGCESYSFIERNHFNLAATVPLKLVNVSNVAVRVNWMEHGLKSAVDGQPGNGGIDSISISSCDPCSMLIEANDMSNAAGGSPEIYAATYVLVRGDRFGNVNGLGATGGRSAYIVYEQILGVTSAIVDPQSGCDQTHPWVPPDGVAPCFYSKFRLNGALAAVGQENAGAGGVGTWGRINGQMIVRRNNALVMHGTTTTQNPNCIMDSSDSATGPAGGLTNSAYTTWDLGNTCANSPKNTLGVGFIDLAQVTSYTNKNNLYVSPVSNGICQTSGSKFVYDYNYWAVAPDVTCRGSHDHYLGITGLGSFDFAHADWDHMPTYDDFAIGPSGAPNLAGTPMVTPLLVAADWSWPLLQRQWLPECNVDGMMTADNWAKALYADACENVRDATHPTIGAIESL